MQPEQPRRMQVRDVTTAIESVCREFFDDRSIPALYHTELTGPLLDEVHALLDRAHAEAREAGITEGRRQATEGWEREWAMDLGLPSAWPLHPCDGEADARRRAADRAGRTVVSRLVGPWEPAPETSATTEEVRHGGSEDSPCGLRKPDCPRPEYCKECLPRDRRHIHDRILVRCDPAWFGLRDHPISLFDAMRAVVLLCVDKQAPAIDGRLTDVDTLWPSEVLRAIAAEFGIPEEPVDA